MKATFLSVVVLMLSIESWSKLQGSLSMGSEYESNIYYQSAKTKASTVLSLKPEIIWETEKSQFQFYTRWKSETRSYSADQKVNRTDYQGSIAASYQLGKWIMGVDGLLEKRVNPLLEKGKTKSPAISATRGSINLERGFGKKSALKILVSSTAEKYSPAEFNYLDSKENLVDIVYRYKFLPETEIFVGAQSGSKAFPQGKRYYDIDDSVETVKFDNTSQYLYSGIRGRLTKYTSILAGFGLKKLKYTKEDSFSEPVFYVEFTDQISPKDVILAGYDYRAVDSSFTNWVLEQDMYIGYSRILRDTFVFQTRLSYVYYSYSLPQRREDQRILGKFNLDYVFRPKWVVSGGISLDLLTSDAYDSSETTDRPADYTNNQIYFHLKRSF